MKKKHLINITIAIACLLLIVYSGISISKMLLSQKQDTITLNESEDKVIAMENKQTKMTKLETKEYYYYEIEDYERDLKYSWKFKKDENKDIAVEESLFIEDDLRLSLDAQKKKKKKIKEDVSQDKLIITFDYHGNLPLETTVRINVQDKFKDNERLYLYYYNPELDQIEYIAHNVLVKDGYVEFELEHCSDYFLTAAVVNDAVNNPQSVNYIIIGLIVVVFILVAVTLFQSKK